MAFPDNLKPLLNPLAYPHSVGGVQLVETHISWILLTGEFAYKIKRPVAFAFVDLRSAEHRAFLCREEIRLNRRFAPDLYLGVSNITAEPGGARMDGPGAVSECAVKMRQFDRSEELDKLLESAAIETTELAAFGAELAKTHAWLPVAERAQPFGSPAWVRETVLRNFGECLAAIAKPGDVAELAAMRGLLEQRLESAHEWMARRQAGGRVRECHGDLHCSNVVRLKGRLLAFDCLEFEPAFRWIDVADEVAFLLSDLDALERPMHAQAFLGGYLAQAGDYDACRFLDLYKAHRSLVRAKVTALSGGGDAYQAHLRCARSSLSPRQQVLLLMSGLSGSGKTWLASRLAPVLGAVHLRSDVERKRLAGLAELDASGSAVAAGLYTPEANSRVQQHLLQSAQAVLEGGYTAIVDATFSGRGDRARFAELARRLRIPACIVHCSAPLGVLRSRILERQRQGHDPSEADVAVLDWQRAHYDELRPDEPLPVLEAASGDPDVVERLRRQIETQMRAAAGSAGR